MAEGKIKTAGKLTGIIKNAPKPDEAEDVTYQETWVKAELAERENGKTTIVVSVKGRASYCGRDLVHGVEITEKDEPGLKELRALFEEIISEYEPYVKRLVMDGAYAARQFAVVKKEVK